MIQYYASKHDPKRHDDDVDWIAWRDTETGYQIECWNVGRNGGWRSVGSGDRWEVYRSRAARIVLFDDQAKEFAAAQRELLFKMDTPEDFSTTWRTNHDLAKTVLASAALPADIIALLFAALYGVDVVSGVDDLRVYRQGLISRTVS